MPTAPKYEYGDVAYLKESAALGALEAVKISGAHQSQHGWLYTIQSSVPGMAGVTYGDRRSLINGATFYLSESEFVTLREALVLAIQVSQLRLQKLQDQLSVLS